MIQLATCDGEVAHSHCRMAELMLVMIPTMLVILGIAHLPNLHLIAKSCAETSTIFYGRDHHEGTLTVRISRFETAAARQGEGGMMMKKS